MTTQQLRMISLSCTMALMGCSACGEDIRAVAGSPYSIQAYVHAHERFNAGDLWKALGISELVSDPRVKVGDARSFDCQPDLPCEAWIQALQLSSDRSEFLAVRFTQPDRELNRYLVFRQTGNAWKLVGHIDSGFAKYFDPVLYPKELSNKWWLVLREQSGSGTGYYESIQRWFELRAGALQEVLSILSDAYVLGYPGEFAIRPTAIVTDFQQGSIGDLFRVLYRVAFTLVDENGVDRAFFGSTEEASLYRRDRSEVAFHPDVPKGTIYDEIRALRYKTAQDLATWFLSHDFQNLMKIARGPASIEQEWLRENLKELPPSEAREKLRRTLRVTPAP
jgi:hypothetical protein